MRKSSFEEKCKNKEIIDNSINENRNRNYSLHTVKKKKVSKRNTENSRST